MTKTEFTQISKNIHEKVLKETLDSIEPKLNKITDKNGQISNIDLSITLFTESVKISSSIITQILENILEFDD